MISFSTTTLLMTLYTTTILIFFCTCILCHERILYSCGYHILVVFITCILIRLLAPIDFPRYTHNIKYTFVIDKIISYFRTNMIFESGYYFSIALLFLLIWLSGFIYKLYGLIHNYKLTNNYITLYCTNVTQKELYKTQISKICQQYNKKNKFNIFLVDDIATPCILGIVHPKILLPSKYNFDEEELFFCIQHEAIHYFHHDIIIKMAISVLSCFYWWFPLIKRLAQQTDLLLEMRNDGVLSSEEQVNKYLLLLCNIKKIELDSKLNKLSNSISLSMINDSEVLIKRIHMLKKQKSSINKRIFLSISGLCVMLLVLSYSMTFETTPHTLDNLPDNYVVPTADNSYFIKNGADSYDLYYDNYLLETISQSELINYCKDIPIIQDDNSDNRSEQE